MLFSIDKFLTEVTCWGLNWEIFYFQFFLSNYYPIKYFLGQDKNELGINL